MEKFLLLGIGSVVGGFARYGLVGTVHKITDASFPYGILVVNVTGCFLIGLFNAISEHKFPFSPESRLLLMVGFCGAFTTFSALIVDSMQLIKSGEWGRALFNLIGSVVLGCLAFLLAETLVKII